MQVFFAFMWLTGVLGVVRSIAQMAEVHAPHPDLYNIVWLGTRFGALCCTPLRPHCLMQSLYSKRAGLVLLEVAVLVFLLQGHLISGQEVRYCPWLLLRAMCSTLSRACGRRCCRASSSLEHLQLQRH